MPRISDIKHVGCLGAKRDWKQTCLLKNLTWKNQCENLCFPLFLLLLGEKHSYKQCTRRRFLSVSYIRSVKVLWIAISYLFMILMLTKHSIQYIRLNVAPCKRHISYVECLEQCSFVEILDVYQSTYKKRENCHRQVSTDRSFTYFWSLPVERSITDRIPWISNQPLRWGPFIWGFILKESPALFLGW